LARAAAPNAGGVDTWCSTSEIAQRKKWGQTALSTAASFLRINTLKAGTEKSVPIFYAALFLTQYARGLLRKPFAETERKQRGRGQQHRCPGLRNGGQGEVHAELIDTVVGAATATGDACLEPTIAITAEP
jgi:hypothetical protein